MYKIAIILPSRGLIFSRTAEEVLNNVKGIPHKIYFSHKKPIPECFNEPTTKALKDKDITHLWFVEDDMIIPENTLKTMLEEDVAVVTADYPVNNKGRGAILRDKGGKILICGTGCTLVKREVFDEIPEPYFRTDIRWKYENLGDSIRLSATKNPKNEGYGLHDVNFCMTLHRKNIPIHQITNTLGQRKLISLGKAGTNSGAHNIETWTKVKKDLWIKELLKQPIKDRGTLITVITKDGEMNVTSQHAKKLVTKGLAKRPPKQDSIIDWGNL